jgi:hypothetical protein
MDNKIENIFLSYLNSPIKNSPESLLNLYDGIAQYFGSGDPIARPKTINELTLKVVVSIIKKGDEAERDFKQMVEDYFKDEPDFLSLGYPCDTVYRTAYHAVYGFQNGYCEHKCPHRNLRSILSEFSEGLFTGSDRLKCYECDKLWFVWIVLQIISGKDYAEIDGFPAMVHGNEECTKSVIGLAKSDRHPQFKTILKEDKIFRVPDVSILEEGKVYPGKDIFNSFIQKMAAFSLIGFLVANDRRRLKHCQFCDKFFIAEDIRRKMCYSADCRRGYHKKDMMKRRDQYKLYGQRQY